MPRVKVSKILSNINFDKCLNDKEHSLLTNVFNDNETNRDRFSLRSGCDDKNKKNIFKDFQKSLKKIETEKINEEGEILTNKILGTSTFTRKEESGEDKMDDLVQSGGGRKRKRHTLNENHLHTKKRRKIRRKKKTTLKRTHKIKKSHKRRVGVKKHHHKKGKRKSRKVGKKHHYKHHNIFRNC